MTSATGAATVDLEALVRAGTYITLRPAPTSHIVMTPSRYLHHEDALRAAWVPAGIKERAGGDGPVDERADASHWLRFYAAAVSTLPFLAMAANIAIDVSVYRCVIGIDDGLPMRLVVPRPQATDLAEAHEAMRAAQQGDRDSLRAFVYGGLLTRHLIPLVELMLRIVKLDPGVLWSDIGESIDCAAAAAIPRVDDQLGRSIRMECDHLFSSEYLPGVTGPNPLRRMIRYELSNPEIYPSPVQVRAMCCACYHIRTPHEYCRNCPIIDSQQRASMYRDWAAERETRARSAAE